MHAQADAGTDHGTFFLLLFLWEPPTVLTSLSFVVVFVYVCTTYVCMLFADQWPVRIGHVCVCGWRMDRYACDIGVLLSRFHSTIVLQPNQKKKVGDKNKRRWPEGNAVEVAISCPLCVPRCCVYSCLDHHTDGILLPI